MAGDTANKSSALLVTALAKMSDATKAIQHIQQNGLPSTDPRHAAQGDPAVAAAITALQALL